MPLGCRHLQSPVCKAFRHVKVDTLSQPEAFSRISVPGTGGEVWNSQRGTGGAWGHHRPGRSSGTQTQIVHRPFCSLVDVLSPSRVRLLVTSWTHQISQAGIPEWVAISFSRGSS